MNPGSGKAHLNCAVRCISGGIVPVLKYGLQGKEEYVIIVGPSGEMMNEKIIPFVGLNAALNGRLTKTNNWSVLYTASVKRKD